MLIVKPSQDGAMITTNMGGADTVIRAAVGSLLTVWAAVMVDQHPFLALGTGFIALAILVTAIAGFCPLYNELGFDTRPRSGQQRRARAGHRLAQQH
jgi:hypothetical protein